MIQAVDSIELVLSYHLLYHPQKNDNQIRARQHVIFERSHELPVMTVCCHYLSHVKGTNLNSFAISTDLYFVIQRFFT